MGEINKAVLEQGKIDGLKEIQAHIEDYMAGLKPDQESEMPQY